MTPTWLWNQVIWLCLPHSQWQVQSSLEGDSHLSNHSHLHFSLPMSAPASSQGVGVCHLTITGQPGRVGTLMSCFLAAGTRLVAIRGWELLRNLVPPVPEAVSPPPWDLMWADAALRPALPWGFRHLRVLSSNNSKSLSAGASPVKLFYGGSLIQGKKTWDPCHNRSGMWVSY